MTSISSSPMIASLSGLQAAQKQISASASNIANQFSTSTIKDGVKTNDPYQPVSVSNSSNELGGVSSVFQPVSPASFPAFLPDNAAADEAGIVNLPNVDLANETVNMITAKTAFEANVNLIKKSDEMQQTLLDMMG